MLVLIVYCRCRLHSDMLSQLRLSRRSLQVNDRTGETSRGKDVDRLRSDDHNTLLRQYWLLIGWRPATVSPDWPRAAVLGPGTSPLCCHSRKEGDAQLTTVLKIIWKSTLQYSVIEPPYWSQPCDPYLLNSSTISIDCQQNCFLCLTDCLKFD